MILYLVYYCLFAYNTIAHSHVATCKCFFKFSPGLEEHRLPSTFKLLKTSLSLLTTRHHLKNLRWFDLLPLHNEMFGGNLCSIESCISITAVIVLACNEAHIFLALYLLRHICINFLCCLCSLALFKSVACFSDTFPIALRPHSLPFNSSSTSYHIFSLSSLSFLSITLPPHVLTRLFPAWLTDCSTRLTYNWQRDTKWSNSF